MEIGEKPGLQAEAFEASTSKLIELVKSGGSDNDISAVEAWFDSHVDLARSDEDGYAKIFMPLYIQLLESIRDHNPEFIKTLDQVFNEEDEFAILGNSDEIEEEKVQEWDKITQKLRQEIREKI